MRVFLVLTQNYWGRGKTLASAKRRCMRETGAKTFERHLAICRNKKWIEYEFEISESLPIEDHPRVDELGSVLWRGEKINRKEHE